jgi:hypothetical protein
MDIDLQKELFDIALDALGEDEDIINRVIEITLDNLDDATIIVTNYALPRD